MKFCQGEGPQRLQPSPPVGRIISNHYRLDLEQGPYGLVGQAVSWCDNEKHWTQIFVKGRNLALGQVA